VTEDSLKAVLSFDPETSTFIATMHNLTAEQSTEELRNLTASGKTCVIADQKKQHKAATPVKCKACKNLSESASKNRNASADQTAPVEGASDPLPQTNAPVVDSSNAD